MDSVELMWERLFKHMQKPLSQGSNTLYFKTSHTANNHTFSFSPVSGSYSKECPDLYSHLQVFRLSFPEQRGGAESGDWAHHYPRHRRQRGAAYCECFCRIMWSTLCYIIRCPHRIPEDTVCVCLTKGLFLLFTIIALFLCPASGGSRRASGSSAPLPTQRQLPQHRHADAPGHRSGQ